MYTTLGLFAILIGSSLALPCPSVNDLQSWGQRCGTKPNNKEYLRCVGCENLIPYAGCTKSLNDLLGVVLCEMGAPAGLKEICQFPIQAIVASSGCVSTPRPSNIKPTQKPIAKPTPRPTTTKKPTAKPTKRIG